MARLLAGRGAGVERWAPRAPSRLGAKSTFGGSAIAFSFSTVKLAFSL
jgi:hypothetical protein